MLILAESVHVDRLIECLQVAVTIVARAQRQLVVVLAEVTLRLAARSLLAQHEALALVGNNECFLLPVAHLKRKQLRARNAIVRDVRCSHGLSSVQAVVHLRVVLGALRVPCAEADGLIRLRNGRHVAQVGLRQRILGAKQCLILEVDLALLLLKLRVTAQLR